MFENRTKDYIQQKAPSTVIPSCMSVPAVKEKFGLETVYKLASNENPFGVSPKAVEAMRAAAPSGHLYSDGTRDKALIAKLAERNGLQSENVFIACGAANALKHVCDVFVRPNDACVIPSPAYPPYFFWAFKNGGRIVEVPCRACDQTLDTEAIIAAVDKSAKVIFLCNPNNPTSTALPREQVVAMLRRLPKDVIVIADEAYVDFADDPAGLTLVPCLAEFPNLVVVRTFSKIYGMASVRLGYALACPEITGYLNKSMDARSISTFGVEGAIAALDDEEFRQKTIRNNAAERAYLTEALTGMGYRVYPSQSNFLWVDFGRPGRAVYNDLLPYGVIIRGDFEFARISIGLHVENETLVNALADIRAKG